MISIQNIPKLLRKNMKDFENFEECYKMKRGGAVQQQSLVLPRTLAPLLYIETDCRADRREKMGS